MEDEYVLISKSEIKTLKEENKKLKKELEKTKTNSTTSIATQDALSLFKEEAQKERTLIKQELNNLKELNQDILNNILTNTNLENKNISEILETLTQIIKDIKDITITDNQSKNIDFSPIISEIKQLKATPSTDETTFDTLEEINLKLDEVGKFMVNLSTLLAQIKPSDMTISPNQTQSPPTQPTQNQNNLN